MYTRRDFGKVALAGLSVAGTPLTRSAVAATAAPEALQSEVRGVKLGLITGSLGTGGGGGGRGPASGSAGAPVTPPPAMSVDMLVQSCAAVGFANIEYSGPTVGMPRLVDSVNFGQPPSPITPAYANSRDAVRQWRLSTPLDPFYEARKKFKNAGLNWFSGVNTISDDCTDAEIDAMFKQMKAMGVDRFCTNQTRVSQGPRMVEFANKYDIQPAWHTHDKYEDPNEVASRESLEKLMSMSPRYWINLDIGHYTAGNQDPVAFIRDHHDRISHLHVKDRKKDHGPNVAWGTGDTPIVECLKLIRDNKYPIVVLIEREYHGPNDGTPVEETRKDMDYMIKALNS
jgi:sugar phosphate isomerase/epimerase